ncbi:MAG: flagellar biosynthetic protein FliP [Deltaproteobacteria bacterium]|nr:MAG: flagellar biosynthetic protein FliP [Deltaproteobacteria bacterium]
MTVSRPRHLGGIGPALTVAVGLGTWVLATSAWGAPPPSDPASKAAVDLLQVADPNAPPASGAGTALRILVVMTALSLLPAIVLTMTCFTRIIIVFSFLRQALGVQGMPPTQVMTGMALFLTLFVMAPVGEKIHHQALEPLMNEAMPAEQALVRAKEPLAEFMLAHTRSEDLRLFYDVAKRPRPKRRTDVDFLVLVPAFTLSEVKTAFQMGFLVLVPFLVVDLVVSSVLMAMGMVMLPPALVALPIKVMLFVLADGWSLVIGSLVRSLAP